MDPAAGIPSPVNLSRFVSMLLEQGRKLQHLTAVTEAIMAGLQDDLSDGVPSRSQALAPVQRMAIQDKFNGDPGQCIGFLMQ